MKARAGAIALLLALVASPAAAQTPAPVTLQQCVTFTAPEGTIIDGSNIDQLLADGTVTVLSILPGYACSPEPLPTEEPVEAFDDDNLRWIAFLDREGAAIDTIIDLTGKVSDGFDDGISDKGLAKRSDRVASVAKKEIAWLDKYPPADCYADIHEQMRDIWAGYRASYSDFAYGLRHDNLNRLQRATDRLGETNDLMADFDLEEASCDV